MIASVILLAIIIGVCCYCKRKTDTERHLEMLRQHHASSQSNMYIGQPPTYAYGTYYDPDAQGGFNPNYAPSYPQPNGQPYNQPVYASQNPNIANQNDLWNLIMHNQSITTNNLSSCLVPKNMLNIIYWGCGEMSHQNCYDKTCSDRCCNYFGFCTDKYQSSYYENVP